jgi:predicted esterase
VLLLLFAGSTQAAEIRPIPRRLPPRGIEISQADRQRIEKALKTFGDGFEGVRRPELVRLLPDAGVYLKAVRFALDHGEFYKPGDVKTALALIETGDRRLKQIKEGKFLWAEKRGLVVRGYQSHIDGSFQPYGLVIPEELDLLKPAPLHVWLHGRGDKTTDMHFIDQRERRVGTIAPKDAIVLHPFGRQCVGFKSAGEIDVLEAIEAVCRNYRIDRDRIVLRGFSMGGAGCWHLGAHYADRWVAMSPGAGFAETARYNKLSPAQFPPQYEQTLWGLYDVPLYARNLLNLPVVAYSGENDRQIQAARVMEEAFASHGAKLKHIIGPGMGHRYHPKSLDEINGLMDQAVKAGLNRYPRKLSLQTRTLRYNRMHWVELLELDEHWRDARVDAEITDLGSILLTTKNVKALRLTSPWKDRGRLARRVTIRIDGQLLRFSQPNPERKSISFQRFRGEWHAVAEYPLDEGLRKTPGLQGPIDDVWLAPFLVVLPSGKCQHEQVDRWVRFESQHFLKRWQLLMRGRARVKKDVDVTDDDINRYHLVVWGDAKSNRLIARLADKLPIRTGRDKIKVGDREFEAATHVASLIYPNPLQPTRYVVLNSGLTFREAHDRTNSLQNPKLPDWAVIDLSEPPSAERPGKIVVAEFFDERWRLKGR